MIRSMGQGPHPLNYTNTFIASNTTSATFTMFTKEQHYKFVIDYILISAEPDSANSMDMVNLDVADEVETLFPFRLGSSGTGNKDNQLTKEYHPHLESAENNDVTLSHKSGTGTLNIRLGYYKHRVST